MRWFGEIGAWLRTKFETKLDINEKIKPILDRQGIGSRIQEALNDNRENVTSVNNRSIL